MPKGSCNPPWGLRVYQGLTVLAGLAGWPMFYWRLKSRGFGESFLPRLGLQLPAMDSVPGQPRLWLHGVSVGEIAGAEPLVRELRQRLPHTPFLLSTGTETGQAVARRLYTPDHTVLYYPLDTPWAVRRYLDCLRPTLYVALETEIWPNFLVAAKARGVRLALVNGRLSDKSLRRYLKVSGQLKYIIGLFDLIGASSEEDARRFVALGASPEQVFCTGNTKFERRPDPAAQAQANAYGEQLHLAAGPVFLAASTHPGEEEAVIAAYLELRRPFPALRLLLAPRHPERAGAVGELLSRAGLKFQQWHRLKSREETAREAVIIIDTVGDLFALYGLAQLIFVGGSLVPHGGQNILEPAAWGKVPLYGPHLQNFRAAQRLLEEVGAGVQLADAEGLIRLGRYCLDHPEEMARRGQRGQNALAGHQGAARRQADLLMGLLAKTGYRTGS